MLEQYMKLWIDLTRQVSKRPIESVRQNIKSKLLQIEFEILTRPCFYMQRKSTRLKAIDQRRAQSHARREPSHSYWSSDEQIRENNETLAAFNK